MSSPASLASRYCGSALESSPETGAVPASGYTRVPRQAYLPVHLLSLAPLLGCAGPVAGDVKLQDDSFLRVFTDWAFSRASETRWRCSYVRVAGALTVCCVWSVMAPSSKCVISVIITHLDWHKICLFQVICS